MTISIRPSTDVALLDRLDQRIFPDDDVYDKTTPATFWWVAWDGDQPIGFAGLRAYGCDGFGYLARAGILYKYRGQGLQRRLIRVRERRARQLKLDTLITYATLDNHASANNLIKCGYLLYEPEWVYGFKNAYYFIKKL